MAEGTIIVTTFDVKGKVSLQWDSGTGELLSMQMIGTCCAEEHDRNVISSTNSFVPLNPSMVDNTESTSGSSFSHSSHQPTSFIQKPNQTSLQFQESIDFLDHGWSSRKSSDTSDVSVCGPNQENWDITSQPYSKKRNVILFNEPQRETTHGLTTLTSSFEKKSCLPSWGMPYGPTSHREASKKDSLVIPESSHASFNCVHHPQNTMNSLSHLDAGDSTRAVSSTDGRTTSFSSTLISSCKNKLSGISSSFMGSKRTLPVLSGEGPKAHSSQSQDSIEGLELFDPRSTDSRQINDTDTEMSLITPYASEFAIDGAKTNNETSSHISLPSLVTDSDQGINLLPSSGSSGETNPLCSVKLYSIDNQNKVSSGSMDVNTDLSSCSKVYSRLRRKCGKRSRGMGMDVTTSISSNHTDCEHSRGSSSIPVCNDSPMSPLAFCDKILTSVDGPLSLIISDPSTSMKHKCEKRENKKAKKMSCCSFYTLPSRRITRQYLRENAKNSSNPIVVSAPMNVYLDDKNKQLIPSAKEVRNAKPKYLKGKKISKVTDSSRRPLASIIPGKDMDPSSSHKPSVSHVKITSCSQSDKKNYTSPPRLQRRCSYVDIKRSREICDPPCTSVADEEKPSSSKVHRMHIARRLSLQKKEKGHRDGQNKKWKNFHYPARILGCLRPRNAFIFFNMNERSDFVASHPHLRFGEISKLLGQLWFDLSDADKEVGQVTYHSFVVISNFRRACMQC